MRTPSPPPLHAAGGSRHAGDGMPSLRGRRPAEDGAWSGCSSTRHAYTCRQATAAPAASRSGARSTCPRAGPTAATAGAAATSSSWPTRTASTLIDYQFKRHFKATRGTHGKGSRMDGAVGDDLVLAGAARDGGPRRRDRPRRRGPHARGPEGRRRARRARRPREHALRDADAARPRVRRARRAGRGALDHARAEAARRRGARRLPQRREVVADRAHVRRAAQDRRLPVHDARAEPRRREGGRVQLRGRGRPRAHRGRERGPRSRARVPAAHRAHRA